MAEEFLSDTIESANPDGMQPAQDEREAVRIMVVGSRGAIATIIHTLYRLGFAQVSEWSKLQIEPVTGEFMAVLTRYLFRK